MASSQLTARRAGRAVALTTLIVTVVAALAIWLVDRDEFPTIGDALWWALQTVTTVGYGDIVPTTNSGRLIGGLVMLFGIGFLTVVTASITAIFVENARARLSHDHVDTHAERLDGLGERLDRIEALLRGKD